MTPSQEHIPDEGPPILKTWPRIYVAVLLYLAAIITLFYAFTRHYAA